MKRILILSVCVLLRSVVIGQNAITTYTLTPYSSGGTKVSCSILTSNGQITDWPVNSIFPQFSRDATKVQFKNVYDNSLSVMSVPDSLKHFYTGSVNLNTVSKMDSFFHAVMLK